MTKKFFNVDEIMRLLDDHKAGQALPKRTCKSPSHSARFGASVRCFRHFAGLQQLYFALLA